MKRAILIVTLSLPKTILADTYSMAVRWENTNNGTSHIVVMPAGMRLHIPGGTVDSNGVPVVGTITNTGSPGQTIYKTSSETAKWDDPQAGNGAAVAGEGAADVSTNGTVYVVRVFNAVALTNFPASLATDSEVSAGYQPLNAELTDLADGTLTGSKVGAGINGDNITSGTVAAGRLDATMATDAEVAAGYQPLDADLTDLSDGTLSGSKVGSGVDAANVTTGTLSPDRLGSGNGLQIVRRNAGNTALEYATIAGGSSLPTGVVVMWSGNVGTNFDQTGLGTNATVSGWAVCNGQNGTPDLRDRFIKSVGASEEPGATGGSATHTPSGTVSTPTFTGDAANLTHTGTAVADHASHTHDYSQVINHTHTVNVNDPGHTHLTQRYPTATGASSGFTIDTSMSGTLADNTLPTKSGTTGITATTANPAGGVATGTTTGPGATLTHSVTQPNAHSYTPSGSVSTPTFTGSSQNTEPSYYKLAYIMKL